MTRHTKAVPLTAVVQMLCLAAPQVCLAVPQASSAVNPYRGAGEPMDQPWAIDLVKGQVKLIPHLQYWARAEADGNKDFKSGTGNDFIVHRARLGAQITAWHVVSAFMQIQDARRWGEEADTLADSSADGLDVHQAWAELRSELGIWARIGRQEMAYDAHRLIDNAEWFMQARSFDALRVGLDRKNYRVHAFWAKIAESDVSEVHDQNVDLLAAHANYNAFAAFEPSLYFLYDHAGGSLGRDRFTFGIHARGNPVFDLSYEADFYYQLGSLNDGAGGGQSINAFLAGIRIQYEFKKVRLQPTIVAFFDYISGDDDLSDGTAKVFDTLYAANHSFYGFADFFLDIPNDTAGRGLMDVGGRVAVSPWDRAGLLVDFHHFQLAQAFDDQGLDERIVGYEIDTVATYTPVVKPQVTFQAGFSVFFPGVAGACVARGGPDCQIRDDGGTNASIEYSGWLMANVLFN